MDTDIRYLELIEQDLRQVAARETLRASAPPARRQSRINRRMFAAAAIPVLVRIAEIDEAHRQLEAVLAENPPWRAQFFSQLPPHISDARTPLNLLVSLKDTPNPPTTGELQAYLDFLIRHNIHDLAHYTWLQFLSPEQLANVGLLFNGRFETRPSGLAFDWVIQARSGVTTDIIARPDDRSRRGLYVEFGSGRVEFGGVAQLLVLAPGTYRLKGKSQGELIGRRGLRWRVSCASSKPVPLAETSMFLGLIPVWREFELTFTVPAGECRAQQLRLALDARSASEQIVTGSIWFAEMQITRSTTP